MPSPLLGLAPGGVCRASPVTAAAVRSYRTLSPSPADGLGRPGGQAALCGTFPGVAPAGRYPAPCFRGARTFLPRDEPGSGRPTASRRGSDSPSIRRKQGCDRDQPGHGRGIEPPVTRPGRKWRWKAASSSASPCRPRGRPIADLVEQPAAARAGPVALRARLRPDADTSGRSARQWKRSPGSILRSGAISLWPRTRQAGMAHRAMIRRASLASASIWAAGNGR